MVPLTFEMSPRSSYSEPIRSAQGAETSQPEAFTSFESHLQDADTASTPPAEPSRTPADSPAADAERQETDDSAKAAPADRSPAEDTAEDTSEDTAEEPTSHEAPVPPMLVAADLVALNLDQPPLPTEDMAAALPPDALTKGKPDAASARPAVRGRIAAATPGPSHDAPLNTEMPIAAASQHPAETPLLAPADSAAAASPETPSPHAAKPESPAVPQSPPAAAEASARLPAESSVVVVQTSEKQARAERVDPAGSSSDVERELALPPLSPADLKSPAAEEVRDRDPHGGLGKEAEANKDAESVEPAERSAHGPSARFGQHLLARADERSDSGRPLSDADQTRFVERVARRGAFCRRSRRGLAAAVEPAGTGFLAAGDPRSPWRAGRPLRGREFGGALAIGRQSTSPPRSTRRTRRPRGAIRRRSAGWPPTRVVRRRTPVETARSVRAAAGRTSGGGRGTRRRRARWAPLPSPGRDNST